MAGGRPATASAGPLVADLGKARLCFHDSVGRHQDRDDTAAANDAALLVLDIGAHLARRQGGGKLGLDHEQGAALLVEALEVRAAGVLVHRLGQAPRDRTQVNTGALGHQSERRCESSGTSNNMPIAWVAATPTAAGCALRAQRLSGYCRFRQFRTRATRQPGSNTRSDPPVTPARSCHSES